MQGNCVAKIEQALACPQLSVETHPHARNNEREKAGKKIKERKVQTLASSTEPRTISPAPSIIQNQEGSWNNVLNRRCGTFIWF